MGAGTCAAGDTDFGTRRGGVSTRSSVSRRVALSRAFLGQCGTLSASGGSENTGTCSGAHSRRNLCLPELSQADSEGAENSIVMVEIESQRNAIYGLFMDSPSHPDGQRRHRWFQANSWVLGLKYVSFLYSRSAISTALWGLQTFKRIIDFRTEWFSVYCDVRDLST